MTTTSLSDIAPVLSTPEFIVRPIVPFSLALQSECQNKGKNNNETETPESIDNWLKNLTEKSAQNSAGLGKNGRRHHKRHRSEKKENHTQQKKVLKLTQSEF